MLQALSNYDKRRHTTAQTTRRPLYRTVCVSIWSDMLEGENKWKSHTAWSLSEYSIKHVSKSGQNRKLIALQVFQLSRSNFHVFSSQRGKAGHPRLLCCNVLLIHPKSVNPNPGAERGCPRRYFLSPLENASYKRKPDLQRSQLAASGGLSAQASQGRTLPNEQVCPARAAISGWILGLGPGKLFYSDLNSCCLRLDVPRYPWGTQKPANT